MNYHWFITLEFHNGTNRVLANCEGTTFVPDGMSPGLQEWARRYCVGQGAAPDYATVAHFSAEPTGGR